MTNLRSVLQWDPDALSAVADQLLADRRALVAVHDDLTRYPPPTTWVASAARPARAAHRRLTHDLNSATTDLASVARAVDTTATTVRNVRAEIDSLLRWATTQGFTVDRSTGAVRDARWWTGEDPHDRAMAMTELADRLRQCLRTAQDADTHLTAVLEAAAAAATRPGHMRNTGDAPPPPPPDGSPHEMNTWWELLTPDQQATVLALHPQWVAGADGIPARVRDRANRALLPRHRAELQAQADALHAIDPQDRTDDQVTALRLLENKLTGLDALDQVLTRGDRQLLLLDTTGSRQLKAAVAVGDLDTASHVAVFTPGFTTTVAARLLDYDQDMAGLRTTAQEQSRTHGDGGDVATVSWLGYAAPQVDGILRLTTTSVANISSAVTGSHALGDFYRGIDASRPVNPQITALGHSYGSTTTGLALQQSTGVDAAVVLGSPGIGTSTLSDLRVPPGQVFHLEAPGDIVANLGYFGADPSSIEGIQGLSTAPTTLDGTALDGSTGHSDYLRPGTTSHHNIATVIAGVPDRRIDS
ncbi:alpha/beta hydrolase [Cellulomonas bogoriensis]|uniref:Alpha/beta hydrolase n=1 Tax=Cellulomonas bogoriensis 69B4 = DSM 16987 TaxID=1386082 RepID=A0A0A0BXC2_9CELL|nr:alpha/beta hydrolase [Cellulomonas bogoriensis]KGM12327.1 alpha/beta hydrolase [Cellulomonas bogoriensis 69B4 = DSM 16987]